MKKLLNAVVGWGRPVYSGEENAPLLNKLASAPAKKTTPAKTAKGGGGKPAVAK